MSMESAFRFAAVAALLLAAGCSAEPEPEEPRVGPIQYGVSYTVGADEYDEEASQRAFDACADLPGASPAGVDQSLPPGLSVRFEGTKAQQEDLETCLRGLPDTRLQGPFEVPDGF
jgi:hypothetical protein